MKTVQDTKKYLLISHEEGVEFLEYLKAKSNWHHIQYFMRNGNIFLRYGSENWLEFKPYDFLEGDQYLLCDPINLHCRVIGEVTADRFKEIKDEPSRN